MSEQALIAYKAALDLFDVLKKQQWVTTNYAVLIYELLLGPNSSKGRPPPGLVCFLIGCAAAVGLSNSTAHLVSKRHKEFARATKQNQSAVLQ